MGSNHTGFDHSHFTKAMLVSSFCQSFPPGGSCFSTRGGQKKSPQLRFLAKRPPSPEENQRYKREGRAPPHWAHEPRYHSAATSAASPLQLARMEAQRQAHARGVGSMREDDTKLGAPARCPCTVSFLVGRVRYPYS